MNIPLTSPLNDYLENKKKIDISIKKVLKSGSYLMGQESKKFEQEFSKYIGSKHCVSCKNGTDALYISLKCLNVGPGDEVVLPSHTAVATCSAIIMTGAKPIFVDIDPIYYTIDPSKIKNVINNRTKVIIAVHLYGQAAEINTINKIAKEKKIQVIEDCAQSLGSNFKSKKLGTFGKIGCFSFFPTKNLGAIGDGGAIVVNDNRLYKKIKRFKQYGWDDNRKTIFFGINSRIDEIQSSILRIKLKKIDYEIKKRNVIAKNYIKYLKIPEIILPAIREKSDHSFHLFVIMVKNRDRLKKFLNERKITTGIHYVTPIHKSKGYGDQKKLIHTENISKNILSLPMFPSLTYKNQMKVIKCIKDFYNK